MNRFINRYGLFPTYVRDINNSRTCFFDSINHIPLVRTSSKIITDSSKTVAPKLISFPTDTAYKGYIGLIGKR